MTFSGRAAALFLIPAALTLAGCVVATSKTYESRETRDSAPVANTKNGGPELLEPPGGPFGEEAPARPARSAPAPKDEGPQLMEPPGGRDVVVDGTPSRPLSPPSSAEPARPRSGDGAYRQAVDCAGAMTALLNSMTYAMSQNEADRLAYEQAAWRAYARSLDGRADKEIDRRAGQLNDITADRILRACPPAPQTPE